MKATIFKALLTIISALLISEAFFVVVHFIITDKYQQATNRLISEYQLSKKTAELVNSFYDLIQYSNDQERITSFKNNLGTLQALLDTLDKSLAGSDSWTVYLGTKNTVNSVIAEVNKGVDNISAENFSEVTASYLKAAQNSNFVRVNAGGLLLKELENVEKMQDEMAKTTYWSELIGILLFLSVALGSVLYAFSFSKKLSEDINKPTPPTN